MWCLRNGGRTQRGSCGDNAKVGEKMWWLCRMAIWANSGRAKRESCGDGVIVEQQCGEVVVVE